jgi:carboxyl-terminal processing protease
MKKFRIVGGVFLFLVIFGLGTMAGILIQGHNSQALVVPQDSFSAFQLIENAWKITRDHYVDRTAAQPQSMAYGAIGGMVDSLGDTGHSTFLTPEELKQENDFEKGQLQGIGVEVQEKNGEVVIMAPLDGSPAQKAGIRSGDIILKVNGKTINQVTDAVKLILGPAGTSVTITIQDLTGATRDVTLVRAVINLTSVSWHQLPGTNIADLRISSFIKGTANELKGALTEIQAQSSSSIILDLRDNPGGLLEEAVAVASQFLKTGNVLLEKDIDGKITPVGVINTGTVNDLPMVVLVNQGTASAAEIVAGALHDGGRAKLVGETTFGTGTVLLQFPLSDGSALVLAVQEWLTPSGKTIWHTGLAPDEVIALAPGASPLFPELEQGLTPEQLQASEDQQLLKALGLLPQNK